MLKVSAKVLFHFYLIIFIVYKHAYMKYTLQTLLSIMMIVKLTNAPVMLAICGARARVDGLADSGR